jgi:L-lactate utilization protein LutB
MEGFYCETKEDALKRALEIVKKGSTVSYGGSMSVKQVGILDAIREGDYNLLDRDNAQTPEEREKIQFETFGCDYYFMSTNAVTVSGELINVDGLGNRIAAMTYGPKHVIMIVGINKVVMDVEQGVSRARNVAAPPNCIRLSYDNPCAATGLCHDCLSEGCICSHTVITRRSRPNGRIKVILVGEELGF